MYTVSYYNTEQSERGCLTVKTVHVGLNSSTEIHKTFEVISFDHLK